MKTNRMKSLLYLSAALVIGAMALRVHAVEQRAPAFDSLRPLAKAEAVTKDLSARPFERVQPAVGDAALVTHDQAPERVQAWGPLLDAVVTAAAAGPLFAGRAPGPGERLCRSSVTQ